MSAFTIPNVGSASYADQARVYAADFAILTAATNGTGVYTGCAVTAKSPAAMRVAVASGQVLIANTLVSVTGADTGTIIADGANPKWSLVEVDSDGVLSWNEGSAAADPQMPTPSGSKVVLAAVYVPANVSALTSSMIVGKGVQVANSSVTAAGHTYYDDNGLPLSPSDWTAVTEVRQVTANGGGSWTIGDVVGYLDADGVHDDTYTLTGTARQLPDSLALTIMDRRAGYSAQAQGAAYKESGYAAHSSTGTAAGQAAAQNVPRATRWTSAASAGAAAGTSTSVAPVCRGAGTDWVGSGFVASATFNFTDVSYDESGASTGSRLGFGLSSTTIATALSADTVSGHFVGFVRRSVNGGAADTYWTLLSRDGSNVSTSATTVTFYPQRWYSMQVGMVAGGTAVHWKIWDRTAGTETSGVWSPTYMPSASTMLFPMVGLVTVDATGRAVDINRLQVIG